MQLDMQTTRIEANIYYRHSPEEIARLSRATIPLGDHIRAVSSGWERGSLRAMLEGRDFRLFEATRTCNMLRRACRHARTNLDQYFELMRPGLIEAAEELEEAVEEYDRLFTELRLSSMPME
jgi:hypothetical protein